MHLTQDGHAPWFNLKIRFSFQNSFQGTKMFPKAFSELLKYDRQAYG